MLYFRWGLTSADKSGRITSPDLCATLQYTSINFSVFFVFVVCVLFWTILSFSLWSAITPTYFSAVLRPVYILASIYLSIWLSHLKPSTLHFFLLNFNKCISVTFSKISKVTFLSPSYSPKCLLTQTIGFHLQIYLSVHSNLKWLIKILSSTRPWTYFRRTPISFQLDIEPFMTTLWAQWSNLLCSHLTVVFT